MSKKLVISIIIILLVLVGLGLFFFFSSQQEEVGEESSIFGFFPFGKPPTETGLTGGDTENGTFGRFGEGVVSDTSGVPVPVLRKITNTATAGATLIETGSTTIRFLERGTGHVYDTYENSFSTVKISNTTIPKIYEAVWTNEGSGVIIRFLKEDNETIESFYAKLPGEGSSPEETSDLEGTFLTANILGLSASPEGGSIFSVTESATGGVGMVSKPDGSGGQSFSLPVKEWLVSWSQTNIVSLTTKPSAEAEGFLYFINARTGILSKILGNIKGLTALTRSDGQKILYSESVNSKINLYLFDRETGGSSIIPFETLPEKCVWGTTNTNIVYCAVPKSLSSGNYPDIWYQGIVSFNDSLWKINTNTKETELIYDFSEQGAHVDLIQPILNTKENYLLFLNKKDLSLWGLRLAD